ncbi:hypothetical protein BV898_12235 [Hypsibius exemplaris]|uniref:Uncharacterized protein n=1 Tax=Hypsibius exemplaris TaxID=2072580 RepID=A0A1W0WE86_HYPEX|nr:hypothetical protein BV898_12235 [Hypsibius exemplaris]
MRRQIQDVRYHLENLKNFHGNAEAEKEAERWLEDAFGRANLASLISYLHERCTTHEVTGCLVNDVANSCNNDWKRFVAFEAWIALTVTETLGLFIEAPSKLSSRRQDYYKIFPDTNLRQKMNEIVHSFESPRLTLKSDFLRGGCMAKRYGKCGNWGAENCCPLSCKVYDFLRQSKQQNISSDDTLANKLAKDIRTSFPQFEWGVVVTEVANDSKEMSYIDLQNRHLVYARDLFKGRPAQVDSCVHNKPYGIFRIASNRKRATLFWTEKQNIIEGAFRKQDVRAAELNNVRKNVRQYLLETNAPENETSFQQHMEGRDDMPRGLLFVLSESSPNAVQKNLVEFPVNFPFGRIKRMEVLFWCVDAEVPVPLNAVSTDSSGVTALWVRKLMDDFGYVIATFKDSGPNIENSTFVIILLVALAAYAVVAGFLM